MIAKTSRTTIFPAMQYQSFKARIERVKGRKIFLYLSILFLFSFSTDAAVDPPNYDFSLDRLNKFLPGKKIAEIKKEYGDGELVFNTPPFITLKFYVEHIRYKFPIFVQFKEGTVVDFHARLPQYFLHNIFHQSMINRYGPQDEYKRLDEQAFYVWKNKIGIKHIYGGACTITCFPIYYAAISNDQIAGHEPVFKKLLTTIKKDSD
jgi:hypothetical protein